MFAYVGRREIGPSAEEEPQRVQHVLRTFRLLTRSEVTRRLVILFQGWKRSGVPPHPPEGEETRRKTDNQRYLLKNTEMPAEAKNGGLSCSGYVVAKQTKERKKKRTITVSIMGVEHSRALTLSYHIFLSAFCSLPSRRALINVQYKLWRLFVLV